MDFPDCSVVHLHLVGIVSFLVSEHLLSTKEQFFWEDDNKFINVLPVYSEEHVIIEWQKRSNRGILNYFLILDYCICASKHKALRMLGVK